MLMIKGIVRVVAQTGFFGAVLLIPAGTWQWPRAIQFLVVFGLVALISTVALALLVPESLEARVQTRPAKNQPVADRVVSLLLGLSLIAWFIFIPIDVFRLRLLPPLPIWVSAVGAAVSLIGYGVMLAALVQNSFAVPVVADQSERGQVLVDTGLYGHIRHPMYLGLLLFLAGLGLWLQSYASVTVLPLTFAPVIARILVEERTLRKTLPAYAGYSQRVCYRLFPRVW